MLAELEALGWYSHAETTANAGLWTMLRRLPALIARALVVAWGASKTTTIAAVVFNVAAGVAVTSGLIATKNVAAALFTQSPTVDRFVAAAPSLVAVAIAAGARAGLGIAAGWAQSRLKPLVTNAVEVEFFALSMRVPLAAFDDDDFADSMQRCRDRGLDTAVWLVQYAIDAITGAVTVVAVAVAIASFHPILLVLLAVAACPAAWAALRSAKIGYLSFQTRVSRRRRLWILLMIMADTRAAADVRSLQLAPWLSAQHRAMARTETSAETTVANKQAATRAAGSIASGAAAVGVYGVLAWLLATGAIPIAAGAAAVLALQQGTSAMRNLINAVNECYDSGLYAGDHQSFIDDARTRTATANPASADDATPRSTSGTEAAAASTTSAQAFASPAVPDVIALDNVSLRYPGAQTNAITDISLTIAKGQTVALVGENGSGKTTLAKVLACLYQPTSGTMAWDGIDTTTLDVEACRSHIGVIGQDVQRWPFTAAANIRIGRAAHTTNGHAKIETSARAVGVHDTITDLPHGYATLLDKTYKDGVDLSGGQWQRLSAARGHYRAAPILICDEPSAALDPRAEHALFDHLRHRDGTTILITHRLANIRTCDLIIVLDKGHLIETGSHDELMAQGGQYAELFTLQAKSYSDH
ncbi:MAG TPA: ATP-binding cassette domain-containing protein [Stackebrandtia sp.]|uniref:ATP-binding cassette domain-containing protein n=1 Tax=Stackebrandtia sp. TaxID=2023065 RepID=UPI002D33A524|nr:ATP-binding cassette domain-containing protein [Stackebrandtia sp.]HZE38195.1 ATP-binding cassette domain-containing protein [Stackebrandtia sp.]